MTFVGVTVRSCRYRVLRQSGKHRRTASRSGPGALPAQGHKPVLAVDDARVRLARSHVHTGFTERLRSWSVTVRPSRDGWDRTSREVPAIIGDPSVLLAAPPPDGGWTPRLGRTVTVECNRSVVPVYRCCGSRASIVERRVDPVRAPSLCRTSTGAGRRLRQRPVGQAPRPYRLDRTVTSWT